MLRAEQCLNDLSESLGDKPFFMGKYPTSLDAVIYGYLAILNSAPLVNCSLQTKLHNLRNLTAFVRKMTNSYFPDTQRKYSRYPIQMFDWNSQSWLLFCNLLS